MTVIKFIVHMQLIRLNFSVIVVAFEFSKGKFIQYDRGGGNEDIEGGSENF